ncbi:MAG: methyltransferase domain-containing protein [Candidatus Bathyarchaeia archaeon]
MSQPNQTTYLFVSGKNWKLSLAELTSYLTAREYLFEVTEVSRAFFAVRTEAPLPPKIIDDLGGTLKIGQASTVVDTEVLAEAFLNESKQAKEQLRNALGLDILADAMPAASSGKSVFGVSVYWSEPAFNRAAAAVQRFLGGSLKDELKTEGRKARFMGFPKGRPHPQLTPVEVLKKGLVEDHAEILLCIGKQKAYVGASVAVHNPFEFQKRDVEKPVQRRIFAIPPRVAKIMVNLAGCAAGKVFLDPFCGVGTILQEALLCRAKVIGVDINRWCVEGAKRNLEWLRLEYSVDNADFAVVQGDARKLTSRIREEVDCIATEPDLGPALRQVPTAPYAERIIEKLTPLFTDFLREAHKVLRRSGRLVIVTPYIKVRSGKPGTMNIREIAADAGFEVVEPFRDVVFAESAAEFLLRQMSSFVDIDERHIVGREIRVFQKP